ncbi:uncharacterized protein LOC124171394 isoform X2 [Ischnura elegans]|uniref:uncharacterized protein LOC124171394 isoform X2 n=1 Tax=Ischnura elegans TaxID=197161 RepID=UPI001ED86F7A|nr:uncharacterized protein LOC124171394 isoform X2 [Ischnura elegans]
MAAPHLRSRLPSHRDPVEFSIRGPVAVSLDEEQLTSPGCSVIDLLFPAATHVGELVFRNYYSGWISVLVRPGSSSSAEGLDESRPDRSKHPSSSWCMSVGRKTLMPLPHQEIGSHDLVSVVATELTADGSLRCVDSASGPKEQAMPRKGSTDAGKGKRGETRPALLQRQQDGHLAVLHTRTALVWSPGNSSRGSLHSSRGGAHPKVVGTGGYEIVGLPQL